MHSRLNPGTAGQEFEWLTQTKWEIEEVAKAGFDELGLRPRLALIQYSLLLRFAFLLWLSYRGVSKCKLWKHRSTLTALAERAPEQEKPSQGTRWSSIRVGQAITLKDYL